MMKDEIEKYYTRSCPKCKLVVIHKEKWNRDDSEKKAKLCRKCYLQKGSKYDLMEFIRKCPTCEKQIKYKNIYGFKRAEQMQCLCKSCAELGSRNHFYGKHHNEKTKLILSSQKKDKKLSEQHKTKVIKAILSRPNPLKNTCYYNIWLKKYGKDVADEKYKSWTKKLSEKSKGKGNPMYGKPAPNGSGQGWKGWYKLQFFRSLRELSYMIYLEENNLTWETGESKKYMIEYIDYNGIAKTYRPDFIVEKNKMIEIKPLKLHNSPLVLIKKTAAEKFCKQHNLNYQLIDFEINLDKIYELYKKELITFIKNYESKFLLLVSEQRVIRHRN